MHLFGFITKTYGSLPESEILLDLQTLFLVLAKRYKPIGKNFCAYVKNTYKYEVNRHIKSFISNPANVPYRNVKFEDYMLDRYIPQKDIDECIQDNLYEDNMGIPDYKWLAGITCSDEFKCLNTFERKLIIKYYLEEYSDRQIAEEFGINISTVNQSRRAATLKLAKALGKDKVDIIRRRKTGLQSTQYIKKKE